MWKFINILLLCSILSTINTEVSAHKLEQQYSRQKEKSAISLQGNVENFDIGEEFDGEDEYFDDDIDFFDDDDDEDEDVANSYVSIDDIDEEFDVGMDVNDFDVDIDDDNTEDVIGDDNGLHEDADGEIEGNMVVKQFDSVSAAENAEIEIEKNVDGFSAFEKNVEHMVKTFVSHPMIAGIGVVSLILLIVNLLICLSYQSRSKKPVIWHKVDVISDSEENELL